jgi:protoporphyrin/coproporphyrin ferrochelatase
VARWLLVHGIILRQRPKLSAEAYAKVWTPLGSPLLSFSREFEAKVQSALGEKSYRVALGMNYGNPSIHFAVQKLARAGVSKIVALPLYPQYSTAATRSAETAIQKAVQSAAPGIPCVILPEFYRDPGFISAFVEVCRDATASFKPDFLLFSFHGLPERQIRKTDPSHQFCLSRSSCCDAIIFQNTRCYRAQCFETARLMSKGLGLAPHQHTVGFQSRLGATPWIKPYTDHLYVELARKGVKRLAVACPSFVADCLETLEEVAIRGKQSFIEAGGEDLLLIPSLNTHPAWVKAAAAMVAQDPVAPQL